MAISDDDIDRVRATVSIVDVVGQHVQLRRTGRNWVGLCPFHGEKTPSFNVREETGRYKCFGCDASGDVFTFVQQTEHVDFIGSVEFLAAKAGIQLNYTSTGQSKDRARRKRLIEGMETAVEWYHQRLLTAPDARPARDYLRSRGIDGEIARQFRIGWAPDEWDALASQAGVEEKVLDDVGLAFRNRRNRMQDALRGRVVFPIMNDGGDPVAVGGRILPGSADPAKYKNSPETPIYTKSRVLYGLNWAKGEIVRQNLAVVCEGYTDVIGFHRSGVPTAVATCGTAFTEEHVKLLKRYTSRVVLAFDADAAGQGAAERFYEWERKYDIEVSVAKLLGGKDPGDLAQSDPESLPLAIEQASPFLAFRIDRVLATMPSDTPEHRTRAAESAMAVVNEHPNVNVRKLYAGEVATRLDLPVHDLVLVAEKGGRAPELTVPAARRRNAPRDNAEFAVLAVLVQDWDAVAPWLAGPLFSDTANRQAFDALVESDGDLEIALDRLDGQARDVVERAAIVDVVVDAPMEARVLIAAAVRRELRRVIPGADSERIASDAQARRLVEDLQDPHRAEDAAEWLLGWLIEREEVADGAS
ncbi:MAG: DNA primase [Ilumatobacteraceae bacterium]